MKKPGRLVGVLLAVGVLTVMFALPVLATDEGEATTPEPIADTEQEGASGLDPAVPIPETVVDEAVPDWTYRYLVPTGLALAVAVIVVTSIQYFTNVVRKRYRIVEE